MADLVGKTLKNRYEVLESLGRGGMAEVYKVWDNQRGVHLAMKVLREDLAEDRVFLRRFQREAENLSKLQHPNIVRFYGLEQDAHLAFILMEFIEGTTLRRQIFDTGGPMPVERVLQIMQPVCSALQYAHQTGLLHCDLKSGNIMLDEHGKVYLTDFGIARMSDAATATLVGAGTPAYMAPELVRGEEPTPQTDIYALGVVLYEMLTGGERPFTGEQASITGTTAEKVRWEQVNLPPTPLSRHNPGLSSILEMAVFQALEKQTGKRFLTPIELSKALERTKNEITSQEGKSPQSDISAPLYRNQKVNDEINKSQEKSGESSIGSQEADLSELPAIIRNAPQSEILSRDEEIINSKKNFLSEVKHIFLSNKISFLIPIFSNFLQTFLWLILLCSSMDFNNIDYCYSFSSFSNFLIISAIGTLPINYSIFAEILNNFTFTIPLILAIPLETQKWKFIWPSILLSFIVFLLNISYPFSLIANALILTLIPILIFRFTETKYHWYDLALFMGINLVFRVIPFYEVVYIFNLDIVTENVINTLIYILLSTYPRLILSIRQINKVVIKKNP